MIDFTKTTQILITIYLISSFSKDFQSSNHTVGASVRTIFTWDLLTIFPDGAENRSHCSCPAICYESVEVDWLP